jgi:hypothetical protein
MEDAEDFDSVAAHAVGDQIRSIGDHQIAGALDAPGAAQRRMLGEQFHRGGNGFHHAGSGGGIANVQPRRSRLWELREGLSLGDISIRELIEEGRE